ncbi:hypothetical protein [Methylophilus flavus]
MNASDKELLLLAAKAARYAIVGEVDAMVAQPGESKAGGVVIRNDRGGDSLWNPLSDDGDALRLAVNLGFTYGIINQGDVEATRRAIVRAAAELERGL